MKSSHKWHRFIVLMASIFFLWIFAPGCEQTTTDPETGKQIRATELVRKVVDKEAEFKNKFTALQADAMAYNAKVKNSAAELTEKLQFQKEFLTAGGGIVQAITGGGFDLSKIWASIATIFVSCLTTSAVVGNRLKKANVWNGTTERRGARKPSASPSPLRKVAA